MSWTEIAPNTGVYTAEYRIPSLPCRSYAVRLADETFAVISPGADLTPPEGGEVSWLVAPSSFHWMGIPKWTGDRAPNARVAAPSEGIKRLRGKGLKIDADISALTDVLPEHVQAHTMPGTRVGELWLRVETEADGVVWMVNDAFFNMKRPSSARGRFIQRVGASGPGLKISRLMKWGGMKDRKASLRFINERLEADAPRILVPTHGEILRSDTLPEQIQGAIKERF